MGGEKVSELEKPYLEGLGRASTCGTCAGLWSVRIDKFTWTEHLEQCLLRHLLNKLCFVVAVLSVPQEHSVPSVKGLSIIWSSVSQEPSHD